MPLALRPNITSASRQFDHLMMSGELCVGRIYKREPANSPETAKCRSRYGRISQVRHASSTT